MTQLSDDILAALDALPATLGWDAIIARVSPKSVQSMATELRDAREKLAKYEGRRRVAKWAGDPTVLYPNADVEILAEDGTDPSVPARRACWIRYWPSSRDFPAYRSCDLSDLDFEEDPAAFPQSKPGVK
jgi:hypothetical protein